MQIREMSVDVKKKNRKDMKRASDSAFRLKTGALYHTGEKYTGEKFLSLDCAGDNALDDVFLTGQVEDDDRDNG